MFLVDKDVLFPSRKLLRGRIMTNCILHLPLSDEGMRSTNTRSFDNNHWALTYSGTTWGTTGRTLDGTEYIEFTSTPLNFTSEDFSFILWVNFSAIDKNNSLMCRGLANTDGYYFFIDGDNAISFRTYQASAQQYTSSAIGAVTTSTWYHIAITRSGNSVKLYKDASDVTNTAGTHVNPVTSARTVKIGIYDDKSSSGCSGTIGEFYGYNRKLSLGEIRYHKAKTEFRYL